MSERHCPCGAPTSEWRIVEPVCREVRRAQRRKEWLLRAAGAVMLALLAAGIRWMAQGVLP